MSIHVPGKVLLHKIPLKFVQDKVTGGGKKSVNQELPLVPFIDFLITLIVFLIMQFAASGEIMTTSQTLRMPDAEHTVALEPFPVIAVDASTVSLDGSRMASTPDLGSDAQVSRIEPLIQALEQQRRNWDVLHPNESFSGDVILQADVNVDFRVIKKVMFSAAQAGYANVSFAVNATGATE